MKEKNQSPLAALTVIFAGLAIFLSQVPPILEWMPNRSLELRHTSEFSIANDVGMPYYLVGIEVENKGNRHLNVSSIEMELTAPNGQVRRIPVYSFQRWESNQWMPFTNLRLDPGQLWSKYAIFRPDLSPSEEQQRQNIYIAFEESASEQFRRNVSTGEPKFYEFEEDLVEKARHYFSRQFYLEKGHYIVRFLVHVSELQAPNVFVSQFILYENDIRTIIRQAENFNHGAGVISDSPEFRPTVRMVPQ